MMQFTDLSRVIGDYLDPGNVAKVKRAYNFGAKAHEGQQRLSGEPYINHPLEVARILGEMHMDHQTLQAALLHDVIEDTGTNKQALERRFGKSVAELVDGVSKLTLMKFDTSEEKQAHNFRKMIMAMSNDIRVILVKLADRLHNMRTLEALPPEKRRRIARETLDIYAPIAQRLGMNNIRLELEELGFKALHPLRHRILTEQVIKARGHRKEIIDKIRNALRRRLRQEKIPAQILGREKHLFGIYRKMYEQKLSFNEVYDVYAFRLLVDSVDTCYRAIGVVHNLYRPVPGKFKDYIAIPKANGYQSLHTVLFGPYGVNIEVQIRTHDMNEVAESGIAAHWLYKTGASTQDRRGAHKRAREWLQSIMEMQQTAGNPQEFLSNVKVDLFPESVYVFTPRGKIIELPRGATAVDFAYAIHTDVGNTCTGARVNKRLVPLGTQLVNGNVVEILTSKSATPNPGWLNFVITARARAAIRHYLKTLKQNEAVSLGKRLLIRELQAFSLKYADIDQELIRKMVKEYKLADEEDLLCEIGLGNRMAPLIARKLIGGVAQERKSPSSQHTMPLAIKGSEGMVITFPKCCHPLPGDPIVGVVTSGRGIVVHNQECKNVAEFQHQQDKWIEVEWSDKVHGEFHCGLGMDVTNQRGMLATIATAISSVDANILGVDIKDKDDRYTRLSFLIEVRSRRHLAEVMRRVRRIKHVSRITRN